MNQVYPRPLRGTASPGGEPGVETVDDFVGRTNRPLVPFLADCYPWTYAHHYLRLERESLPAPLQGGEAMSQDDATDLVHRWCEQTGEDVDHAARALADA